MQALPCLFESAQQLRKLFGWLGHRLMVSTFSMVVVLDTVCSLFVGIANQHRCTAHVPGWLDGMVQMLHSKLRHGCIPPSQGAPDNM